MMGACVRTKVLPLRLQRDSFLAAEARRAPDLVHTRGHACADARAHAAALSAQHKMLSLWRSCYLPINTADG